MALAAPRNDIRATSLPIASRNSGTGSVGTLRRLPLMHRPRGVQFVRLSGGYTLIRYHTSRNGATPRGGHARVSRAPPVDPLLGQLPDRPRGVPLGSVFHVDYLLVASASGVGLYEQYIDGQV